jgi:hypothetical protein
MSDSASEPDETQQPTDEEEDDKDEPADWGETQDQPHEGEEGQDIV